jgi:hypothetical protein
MSSMKLPVSEDFKSVIWVCNSAFMVFGLVGTNLMKKHSDTSLSYEQLLENECGKTLLTLIYIVKAED